MGGHRYRTLSSAELPTLSAKVSSCSSLLTNINSNVNSTSYCTSRRSSSTSCGSILVESQNTTPEHWVTGGVVGINPSMGRHKPDGEVHFLRDSTQKYFCCPPRYPKIFDDTSVGGDALPSSIVVVVVVVVVLE